MVFAPARSKSGSAFPDGLLQRKRRGERNTPEDMKELIPEGLGLRPFDLLALPRSREKASARSLISFSDNGINGHPSLLRFINYPAMLPE
ncbi:MAG: hypothetical protein MZV70_58910 [Desulfobacterales bacterium]|nr:hypothetical protein [Desulfobacterales bacterium]